MKGKIALSLLATGYWLLVAPIALAGPSGPGTCASNGAPSFSCPNPGTPDACGSGGAFTCLAAPNCAANQRNNCASPTCACVCDPGLILCGAACQAPIGGSCAPGQTLDQCTGLCVGNAYAILSPASVQTGNINITGQYQVNGVPLSSGLQGSGTPDRLPKYVTANTLGNSVFVESSGRIGIGTSPSNPLYTFDVQDTQNAYIRIGQRGATKYWSGLIFARTDALTEKWFLGMDSLNDNFHIRRDGTTDALSIDASGNIGIGTNNPSQKVQIDNGTLKIGGTLATSPIVGIDVMGRQYGVRAFLEPSSAGTGAVQGFGNLGSGVYGESTAATAGVSIGVLGRNNAGGVAVRGEASGAVSSVAVEGVATTAGAIGVRGWNATGIGVYGFSNSATGYGVYGYNNTNGYALYGVAGSAGYAIYALGNGRVSEDLSVGTSSALRTVGVSHGPVLQVHNAVDTGTSGNAILELGNFLADTDDVDIEFRTSNGTRRAFISYRDSLANAANPNFELGTSAGTGASVNIFANGTSRIGITAAGDVGLPGATFYAGTGNARIGAGAAPVDKLSVIGDVRVGTALTNGCVKRFDGAGIAGACASDARLKQDVAPLVGALEVVAGLRPVTFRWRADAYPERAFGTGTQIGLVAQDVENVAPSLVGTGDDGFKTVDLSALQFYLIGAVQEQQEQIESLEARIKALEN